MRKRTCVIIFLWIVIALGWAFIFALKCTDRTVFVQTHNLESVPGVRLLDPNAGLFEIISREPGRIDVKWSDTRVRVKGDGRVKMRENSRNVQVLGTLSNGKSYPVVIDTGFSKFLAAIDTVVVDAGLAIYPVADLDHPLVGGLCELPRLKIGDVAIEQSPCVYWLAHYERRVLCLTTWKEMKINLGFGLLKEFSYIRIDNVDREVEFAAKKSFIPRDESQWEHHPMVIEHDEKGDSKLMVDILVADHVRHIAFDTGATFGLTLTEKIWTQVSPGLQLVREEKNRLATPLSGWLPCRKITVEMLRLGNTPIRSAQINVTTDNNPMGEEDFTLGMGFFQETEIVLDFKNELLWIRNPAKPTAIHGPKIAKEI
jgi:hypothetical protein